jgi:hypothetical protein
MLAADTTWVEPYFDAEITYAEITGLVATDVPEQRKIRRHFTTVDKPF